MANLAIVGAQWGDEGKGKVIDLLAPKFSIVARFQGGPNAGHTVVFDGNSHALHHIPSGIFHEGVKSIVGPGALVDPVKILEEIRSLEAQGVPVTERLRLSDRIHVIMPYHRTLDGAFEARLKDAAIGTTRRGIGPAYSAKMQRRGIRLGDLGQSDEVRATLERILACGLREELEFFGEEVFDPEELARQAAEWWEQLAPFCCNTTALLHEAIAGKNPILFEGAQGSLLDVDHGSFPFVTSSSTVAGGIPAGLGIPPKAVGTVVGVMKAYLTRVGSGPFPTEDHGPVGDRLRDVGCEFGTTTGRPRRCGFFDAVAARYAVRLNGLDALAITKFDVLGGLDKVKICVAYEVDGERLDYPPSRLASYEHVTPIYEEHEGWESSCRELHGLDGMPKAARSYLDRVCELSECPIGLVSVGPDRLETIVPRGSILEDFGCPATGQ